MVVYESFARFFYISKCKIEIWSKKTKPHYFTLVSPKFYPTSVSFFFFLRHHLLSPTKKIAPIVLAHRILKIGFQLG